MPNAQEFLNGFGLVPGTMFADYQLVTATATHQTIKRYQEYEYHITLVFMGHAPNMNDTHYRKLFDVVMATTTQQHTIYGVRNPYRCTIENPTYGSITGTPSGPITFTVVGHSYRI